MCSTPMLILFLLSCCPVRPITGRLIFPSDDRPPASAGRCQTPGGGPGLCVTFSSHRCSLFPSAVQLAVLRPRLCSFSRTDPVICCPVNKVLSRGGPPPATGRSEDKRTTAKRLPTRRPTKPTTVRVIHKTSARSESPFSGNRRTPTTTNSRSSRLPQLSSETTTANPIGTSGSTRRRELVSLPSRPPPVPPNPPSHSRSSLSRPNRLPGCGFATPLTLFRVGGQYFVRPPARVRSVAVHVATQPWTVLVGFVNTSATGGGAGGGGGNWICVGALLSPRLVVTAARCVVLGGSPHRLVVGLGDHDLATSSDGTGGVVEVAAFRKHPEHVQPSRRHDLALLLLRRAAPRSPLVRHVCLPSADPPPTAEQEYEDDDYFEDDEEEDGTEQQQLAPAVGTPMFVSTYDLDALWTVKQAGRGRQQTNITSVAPLDNCTASLAAAPLAGFLYPGGLLSRTELCLPAAASDGLCRADVGSPIVARGEGNVAQLEALHMLDGCGAAGGRPQVALRVRHYVPWLLETIDSLLAGQEKSVDKL